MSRRLLMAVLENAAILKLWSNPQQRRPGFKLMSVALVVGFAFSGLWFFVSIGLIFQGGFDQIIWGALIGLSALVYGVYLGIIGYKLIADGRQQYDLEVTGSEVVLSVCDTLRKRKSTQMVVLDDVKYAEYYPYPDSASVYLYAPYTVMEIPLWPFGGRGGDDVIDFLKGRGIPVMNVQFDDKVPES